MSKFCLHCGAEIDDASTFCEKCGASQEAEASESMPAVEKKKSKLPLIIVASVVGVIVLVLAYFIFIRSTYSDPVDNFVDAFNNQDVEAMYELMPEEYWEERYEENYSEDDSEYEDYDDDEYEDYYYNKFEDDLDDLADNYEETLGDDGVVSCSILDDFELPEDMIDELEQDFYDIDIDEAYEICVKMTFEGDDDEYVNYASICVFKCDGNWYSRDFLSYLW